MVVQKDFLIRHKTYNPEILVVQLILTRKYVYYLINRTYGKQGFIKEHLILVKEFTKTKKSIKFYLYILFLVFDEDFVFEERPSVIGRRTIEILLYDFDAYSRHVCIGGTQIQLDQLDLSKKVVLWNPLGSCADQVIIIIETSYRIL